MIIHDVQQGTSEWLRLRAGRPTSSSFDQIITPGGKPSKSAERYLLTLLAERVIKHPIIEHVSMWMQRGSLMEKDAVSFYELQNDIDTTPVGFMTNDAGTIGASPDRLVGEKGLLEIKVPSEHVHMGYLLKSGNAYDAYRVQVQGQLWVSGREFVDLLSWHPEMPPALTRIPRDEDFIAILGEAVTKFSEILENYAEELKARGWITPEAPAPDAPWTDEDLNVSIEDLQESERSRKGAI